MAESAVGVAEWIVIAHPDGRRYSVTSAVFATVYEPQGFVVEHDETLEDFTAHVPRPAPHRRKPEPKRLRARA